MIIKGVVWFTQIPTEPMITCFGVVYGHNKVSGEAMAYIGAVNGTNEEADVLDIAHCGARLHPAQIKELNDFLNPTKETV